MISDWAQSTASPVRSYYKKYILLEKQVDPNHNISYLRHAVVVVQDIQAHCGFANPVPSKNHPVVGPKRRLLVDFDILVVIGTEEDADVDAEDVVDVAEHAADVQDGDGENVQRPCAANVEDALVDVVDVAVSSS